MESSLAAEQVVRALGALAQEHRLATYRLLVQAGEDGLPAGELAGRLAVPASSLSFHLAQLSNAGLVKQRRQGRSIIYSANYPAMNGLMAYLTQNCCGGVPCGADLSCAPAADEDTAGNAAASQRMVAR